MRTKLQTIQAFLDKGGVIECVRQCHKDYYVATVKDYGDTEASGETWIDAVCAAIDLQRR